MRILIAGCGYVGRHVAETLFAAGDDVIAVRRTPQTDSPFPQRAGDLLDPSTVSDLEGTIDGLVYAASPDRSEDGAYAQAYCDGLQTTLHALERRGDPVRRVILTTSTAVYGERDGAVVTETSPTNPSSFRGERLLEAEAIVAKGPFSGSAIRLGGIYGPGRTGYLRRVREGRAQMPAVARYGNRIHRDDAAGAIVHLLRLPTVAAVYNGVDEAAADLREVIRFAAELQSLPVPAPANPAPQQSDAGKRVSSERLRQSGYSFSFPTFREGYRALLEAAKR